MNPTKRVPPGTIAEMLAPPAMTTTCGASALKGNASPAAA
jgi:hypothetical protein